MNVDVLVIGAGILGISSAYHLKVKNRDKRVVVIDRHEGPGMGNSIKSEGGFRNIFTSKINYSLADATIDWFSHVHCKLGFNLRLDRIGYLWLFSQSQWRNNEKKIELMEKHGIEMKILDKSDLERIPDFIADIERDKDVEEMGLESIQLGVLAHKSGSVDPFAVVKSYEEGFIKLGGETHYGTEAEKLILGAERELDIPGEPFIWQDTRILGAVTHKGEIRADTTIVAAGVWADKLLDPLGLNSFMKPKKRQIFAFKDPRLDGLFNVKGLNELGVIPLTVLPKAGIYFKPVPSLGNIWLGCADDIGRRFGFEDNPLPEERYYHDDIRRVLVRYFPCFRGVPPIGMWAGQYAINSYDETPIVISIPGMIYVGAVSGSGIMKSDSLGRIVAAVHSGEDKADLFNGHRLRVSDLGIKNRNVEYEGFVI